MRKFKVIWRGEAGEQIDHHPGTHFTTDHGALLILDGRKVGEGRQACVTAAYGAGDWIKCFPCGLWEEEERSYMSVPANADSVIHPSESQDGK